MGSEGADAARPWMRSENKHGLEKIQQKYPRYNAIKI
jgi:hypothetical protein